MRIEVLAAKKHFDPRLALVRKGVKTQTDLGETQFLDCFCIIRLKAVSAGIALFAEKTE